MLKTTDAPCRALGQACPHGYSNFIRGPVQHVSERRYEVVKIVSEAQLPRLSCPAVRGKWTASMAAAAAAGSAAALQDTELPNAVAQRELSEDLFAEVLSRLDASAGAANRQTERHTDRPSKRASRSGCASDSSQACEDCTEKSCTEASPPSSAQTSQLGDAQQESAIRRLIASGRAKDAADMIEVVHERLDGATVELLRGEICLAQSQMSEASACFMALLGSDPENQRALRAIAEIHRRNDDLESCFAVRLRAFSHAHQRVRTTERQVDSQCFPSRVDISRLPCSALRHP